MPKEIEIQIRFNDLDGYGHVNNSVYLSYCEIARTNCYADIFNDSIEKKIWFILTSAEIKYKKFLKLEDKAFVRVWLSSAKGVLFTFEYLIHDGNGTIYATAKTTHAVYDAVKNKPIRVPKVILDGVETVE